MQTKVQINACKLVKDASKLTLTSLKHLAISNVELVQIGRAVQLEVKAFTCPTDASMQDVFEEVGNCLQVLCYIYIYILCIITNYHLFTSA